MIDHDDIDRLNELSRARVEYAPRVTRRRDGKVFGIIAQARSPDGPVELASVGLHSIERITVNGRDFARDFIDPRKPSDHQTEANIPSPQEVLAKRNAVNAEAIKALVAKIVRQFSDDTAERVYECAPRAVIEGAAAALRSHGWACEVTQPTQRDPEWSITVTLSEVE